MHQSTEISTEAMLADLRQLVEVESPSRDLAALEESAKAVAEILEKRLGGKAVLLPGEAGTHVRWSGGGTPRVLVLGHHDTVFPKGTLATRPFRVADGRATGPGVFDMLGGLVQAVHGLATLDELSGVEILVTADEEVGSGTSRALIEELAQECGAVLVFEGSAEGGGLKTGRKGCGTFRVDIEGRAAHAGLEPAAGVNALVEAAHQVLDIAALSQPEVGTTVTPTVATAGTSDNVVPAEATVLVDVRVESAAEKDRVEAAFAALTPHLPGARLKVQGAVGRPRCPSLQPRSCSPWRSGCSRASRASRSAAAATATSPLLWACRPSTGWAPLAAARTPTMNTWWQTRWSSGPASWAAWWPRSATPARTELLPARSGADHGPAGTWRILAGGTVGGGELLIGSATSCSTLLRRVMDLPDPAFDEPRAIGVDGGPSSRGAPPGLTAARAPETAPTPQAPGEESDGTRPSAWHVHLARSHSSSRS